MWLTHVVPARVSIRRSIASQKTVIASTAPFAVQKHVLFLHVNKRRSTKMLLALHVSCFFLQLDSCPADCAGPDQSNAQHMMERQQITSPSSNLSSHVSCFSCICFCSWIAAWPTVQDLAKATQEQVGAPTLCVDSKLSLCGEASRWMQLRRYALTGG